MINRELNYGRHLIEKYLTSIGNCEKILDIGAGYGDDLLIAAKHHSNAQLNAIECYPDFINVLESRQIKVFPLNIEKDVFPFENESIDVIMANQILEHTKEIFWILHEASRTLKVGGKLIIGVPNLASLHNRLLLTFGRQPTSIKNNTAHLRGYTKGDMINFLDSGFPGGYKLQMFGGSNFYPFPSIIAKPMATLFPTMSWGIFFLFEKKLKYNNGFLQYPVTEQLQTNFYLG
jgi:SAM-dependent methyltransferase